MGWFCNCPRCRLADWDFERQGDPEGEEWEHIGNQWRWTPNVPNRVGGYRIVIVGTPLVTIRLRFANEVEATIRVKHENDGNGEIYYMTIGDDAHVIAATEPLPADATAIRFDLCYWRPTRAYWLRAIFYDSDQQYLGEMHAAIPGANVQHPITFAPPTITFSDDASYVAIDGLQEGVDECCDLCRPADCQRLHIAPAIQSGYSALLYGNTNHVRIQAEITANTLPWLLVTINECCEDNGNSIGEILEIDASLGAETLRVRTWGCEGYHSGGSTKTVPLIGDWQSGEHTYIFTLCIRIYGLKILISLVVTDELGHTAYASVEWLENFRSFVRYCHPEWEGEGDPAEVLDIDYNSYVIQVMGSHTIHLSPGYTDPCWCIPIPGHLVPSLCDSPLCEGDEAPQGWVAEVTNLPEEWWWHQGAYVLSPRGACPSLVTTECTWVTGNEGYFWPSSDRYVFKGDLEDYMEAHYPDVTQYDWECEWRAGDSDYTPDGIMFAFCIEVFRPRDITPYELYEEVPVLVHVRIYRSDPLEGPCERCDAGTAALMMGALPLPACPDWPSITPQKIAEYSWHTEDDRCTETTPSLNPNVTISPAF